MTPYLRQVLARDLGAILVETVKTSRADLFVGDEAGLVQQAEVA
jgi:hypothetical protein